MASYVTYAIDGGERAFSTYSSGLAVTLTSVSTITGPGDFVLISGPGRLNYVSQVPSNTLFGTPNLQSGTPVAFYDSNVATSGGPFVLSGHTYVMTPHPTNAVVASGVFSTDRVVTAFGFPFQNGLTIALKSGQPSVTASYTIEPARDI